LTLNGSAGQGFARLFWSAPISGKPTSYTVQYKRHADAEWTAASSTVSRTRFAVVGLAQDQYDFRVLAANEGGASDPSNVITVDVPGETAAPQGAPAPVGNFIAATPDPKVTEVELSWARIAGAEDYVIQNRLHDSDQGWQQLGTPVQN